MQAPPATAVVFWGENILKFEPQAKSRLDISALLSWDLVERGADLAVAVAVASGECRKVDQALLLILCVENDTAVTLVPRQVETYVAVTDCNVRLA